jgi:acetyl-CoA carboxylase biotin carboxyl carrier protein
MNFKEIQDLIKLVSKSNLTEVKLKQKDFEISIRTKKYRKSMSQPMISAQPMVSMQAPQQVAQAPAPVAAAAPAAPAASPAAPASAETSTDNLVEVKSPIVGTFYRSAGPEKPPFVKVGDDISVGSVVCIVEAMKLFNEIESEVSGKIVKVMIEDASPVEYDQVLFLVDPNG